MSMTSIAPIDRHPTRLSTTAGASRSPALPRDGLLDVEVLAMRPVAHNAVTLALAAPGTRMAPAAYQPGQFITLALPSTSGATLRRSYSLCGDGRANRPWEITVKRVPGGLISNFLLDEVRPGMWLRASRPQGNFTLPPRPRPAAALVFVAAGSGITPLYGMLRALARLDPASRPRVWLHYAYHSPADAIFARELAALDPTRSWLAQRHYISTHGARLRAREVVAALGPKARSADWYICGPATLRNSLAAELQRACVPAERLHMEVFSSPRGAHSVRYDSGHAGWLHLADRRATLDMRPGETLLDALERQGYRPDFSCRAGACGTCRLRLLAGQVHEPSSAGGALTPAERAAGYVLACVGEPDGDVTLASAGNPVAAPRSASAAGARRAGRKDDAAGRQRLRRGLAAAALGLFVGVWQLTNHTPVTQTQSAAATSGTTSSGSSGTNSSSSAGGSSSTSGGSSSITTQPSQSSSSNSSTGAS